MTVPPSHKGTGGPTMPWVEEFGGFFDDAALFPPGNSPMATAVARHREHRDAWYGPVVGTFVCPDRRWDELVGHLGGEGPVLDLSLVVVDGPDSLGAAVARAQTHPRVRLRAVELPVTGGAPGGPEALLKTVAAAVPRTVTVYAEVGLGPGVHQAVRHTGSGTGFEHHGFLNVLAAVAAAHDGADEQALASVLACREPERVARWCAPRRRAAARTWFTSFGTCSIDEPLADLSALRLVGKD